MTFARPTLEALIARVRQDFETTLGSGAVRFRRTVEDVLARSIAGLTHGLHGHAEWVARQQFPSTCDDENLARWAEMLGVERREAVPARGIVTTDAPGFVPIGHEMVAPDGTVFEIEYEIAVAPGALAEFHVVAQEGGKATEQAGGTVLTLDPAWGAHTEATVSPQGLEGGFDAETPEQFRDRVVRRLALPVRGGTPEDFRTWALEVPGVLRAGISINGAGDVTVRPLDVAADGFSPSAPSVARQDLIEAYIAERVPAGFVFNIGSVTPSAINLTVNVPSGAPAVGSERDIAAQIALTEFFARAEVGEDVILSQVSAIIAGVPGIDDHTITSPASNVTIAAGGYAVFGSLTWT
jgi:uncharacterized phage protein gp47/JayE